MEIVNTGVLGGRRGGRCDVNEVFKYEHLKGKYLSTTEYGCVAY